MCVYISTYIQSAHAGAKQPAQRVQHLIPVFRRRLVGLSTPRLADVVATAAALLLTRHFTRPARRKDVGNNGQQDLLNARQVEHQLVPDLPDKVLERAQKTQQLLGVHAGQQLAVPRRVVTGRQVSQGPQHDPDELSKLLLPQRREKRQDCCAPLRQRRACALHLALHHLGIEDAAHYRHQLCPVCLLHLANVCVCV